MTEKLQEYSNTKTNRYGPPVNQRSQITLKSSETETTHSNASIPPLALSSRRNSDTLTDTKSTPDSSQSTPGDDVPKLRRALTRDACSPLLQSVVENEPKNHPDEPTVNNDAVAENGDIAMSLQRSSDVARLSYVNDSLPYGEDANLHEFSVFTGGVSDGGLVTPEQHHRQHHHHHHHHHQKQQQFSRIPRLTANGSRRASLVTSFDPSLLRSVTPFTALPLSSDHEPDILMSPSPPPPYYQAAVPTTLSNPSISVTTKTYSTTKPAPGLETAVAVAAEAEASGRPSRSSHRRSASTWETRQTLADLWTEFQNPTSLFTS